MCNEHGQTRNRTLPARSDRLLEPGGQRGVFRSLPQRIEQWSEYRIRGQATARCLAGSGGDVGAAATEDSRRGAAMHRQWQ